MEKKKYGTLINRISHDISNTKLTSNFMHLAFPSLMKNHVTGKINLLHIITKICLYSLIISILGCSNNCTYYCNQGGDKNNYNDTNIIDDIRVIRLLAHTDVLRSGKYNAPYFMKPGDNKGYNNNYRGTSFGNQYNNNAPCVPTYKPVKKIPSYVSASYGITNDEYIQNDDVSKRLAHVESLYRNPMELNYDSAKTKGLVKRPNKSNNVPNKCNNDNKEHTFSKNKLQVVPVRSSNNIAITSLNSKDEMVEDENNGNMGNFANIIMSNINEVELERNPALELIKENILDHVLSANEGMKKNFDILKENISNTIKTMDQEGKPPIDFIKETILEKLGGIEPGNVKANFEEIKGAIMDKISTNIECGVKPTIDSLKLTVIDTFEDFNAGMKPKINDLKDSIKGQIEKIESDMIPKIGNTIKDCITDKLEGISSDIEKKSEVILDSVMTNVKNIYNKTPNPKDLIGNVTKLPTNIQGKILENKVVKNKIGKGLFGNLKNCFHSLGDTTKAILSIILSVFFAIGGILGFSLGSGYTGGNAGGGIGFAIALGLAYYAIIKLLKISVFSKFKIRDKIPFLKKSKDEEKKDTPPPEPAKPDTTKLDTRISSTTKTAIKQRDSAKHVTTKPITTKPITTKPVTTKPVTTKPVTTKPVTTKPVTTIPVTTKPVTTKSVTTKPVTTKSVTTKPVTTKPVTTKPVTTKRGPNKPATPKRATTS
ncbi:Plasmodium exported protein, unknown function [Plasmodium malariae]|uniref:Uncharacterized protein n=1 Tax=Plasmodium malariae TaxID=5858 RepID=A0A1D3JKY1_PLAMA|nr:Plasmodium exported protein, unknown function [Plasmodium malariae]SBT87209.1 Plasmodium exported protein, unknown function [Plasmodium malariae]